MWIYWINVSKSWILNLGNTSKIRREKRYGQPENHLTKQFYSQFFYTKTHHCINNRTSLQWCNMSVIMCVINGANCWQFFSSITFRFIKFNFIVDTGDITDRLVNNDLYIFLTGDKYTLSCFLQFVVRLRYKSQFKDLALYVFGCWRKKSKEFLTK